MPYRSLPGRPGRKLAVGRGLFGQNMLITQSKSSGPMTPAQYGRQCEVTAAKELKADGWTVTRSHLSRGGADLVASKLLDGIVAVTRHVQVKSCQTFRPTFCNKGVQEILSTPPVWERVVMGYLYGHGHIVTITFAPDGTAHVTGKAPYAKQVETAVLKSLARSVGKTTKPTMRQTRNVRH